MGSTRCIEPHADALCKSQLANKSGVGRHDIKRDGMGRGGAGQRCGQVQCERQVVWKREGRAWMQPGVKRGRMGKRRKGMLVPIESHFALAAHQVLNGLCSALGPSTQTSGHSALYPITYICYLGTLATWAPGRDTRTLHAQTLGLSTRASHHESKVKVPSLQGQVCSPGCRSLAP